MFLFKRIRQYRVYRRLVFTYLFAIVASITIVSTALYFLFSDRAIKEVDQSSRQMLSQVSYTANMVHKQIEDISSQLLVENDVGGFIYAEEVDKIASQKAFLVISKLPSIYTFIADISLYNFTNDEYLDTLGLQRDPQVTAQATDKMYIQFYPRVAMKNEKDKLHLLSFRVVPQWQADIPPKYALVLDLNESYIQNTIGSINASIRKGDTFVLDASGRVLSHSDTENFMADFSQKEYVRRILDNTQNQGSFVQQIDRQKQLVTYVKSSALDWYFVSVRPYSILLSDIYTLRNWTWFISLLLIVIGAAAALFLTGNIYNPIRSLVDRAAEFQGAKAEKGSLLKKDEYTLLSNIFIHTVTLESKMNRFKQALKNSSILSLLKGIDKATVEQIEQDWSERLKGPYFLVVLFKVDNLPSFNEAYSVFDRELIQFAISNIAQELIGKSYQNDASVMEDEIVLILHSDKKELSDIFYLTLEEIQDAIRRFYKLTVTVSVGDWCDSFIELRNSYRSAHALFGYRLFFGYNSILFAEHIQDRKADSRYPADRERKLIDAVKLGSEKAIQREIDEWIAHVSQCTYSKAMLFTNFLLLAMIREFEHLSEWWDLDTSHWYNYAYQIQQVEVMDQMKAVLTDFCEKIVTVVQEKKKHVSGLKSTRVIEEIKQLIESEYADANLSLDYAASQVGLSAGYLGKLFKSHEQITFNDYVTQIRIEQAKQLLLATNDSVAEIGAKSGFLGTAYFSTVFKKETGIAPSQYRETMKRD